MKESPIFLKSYETLVWLLGHTAKFPKNQRFLLAKRMEDAALDFHERINQAAHRAGSRAAESLAEADEVKSSTFA